VGGIGPMIPPKCNSQFIYVLAFLLEFISDFNKIMRLELLEEVKNIHGNIKVNVGEEIHELDVPVDDLAH
jgi:hypothetical protein